MIEVSHLQAMQMQAETDQAVHMVVEVLPGQEVTQEMIEQMGVEVAVASHEDVQHHEEQ